MALPGSRAGDRIQITSLVTQPESVVDGRPSVGAAADGVDVHLQVVDGGQVVVTARHRPSTPAFVPELGLVAVVQVAYTDTSMLISPGFPADPAGRSWVLPAHHPTPSS